jgi:hypothetical protein
MRLDRNHVRQYPHLGESGVLAAALLNVVDGHATIGISEQLSRQLLDLLVIGM